jgi:hypothetical protein
MKTAMLKRAGHLRMSVQLIRQRMHARSEKRSAGRGELQPVNNRPMEKREKYHHPLSEVTN